MQLLIDAPDSPTNPVEKEDCRRIINVFENHSHEMKRNKNKVLKPKPPVWVCSLIWCKHNASIKAFAEAAHYIFTMMRDYILLLLANIFNNILGVLYILNYLTSY